MMVLFMKDILKTIRSMVLEFINSLMVQSTKAIFTKGKDKEKDDFSGSTGKYMMASGLRVRSTEVACGKGFKGISTWASGTMGLFMDLAFTNG
jgi:hypothetical protein